MQVFTRSLTVVAHQNRSPPAAAGGLLWAGRWYYGNSTLGIGGLWSPCLALSSRRVLSASGLPAVPLPSMFVPGVGGRPGATRSVAGKPLESNHPAPSSSATEAARV